MNDMIVKALVCMDNIQESLSVKLVAKFGSAYVAKLLEDSEITSFSEGADIVLKYFEEDREYYIVGLLNDFVEEENYKRETIDYMILNSILNDVNVNFHTKEEFKMLKNYMKNNNITNPEDIERQAIVISGKNLKYNYEPIKEEFDFTEEELELIQKLKLPFDIKDLEYWDDEDDSCIEKNQIAYSAVDEAIKSSQTRQEKAVYESIMEKLFESVPEDEVREIHIYDLDNWTFNIQFLDEAGVHRIVSRKAKLYFKNGDTKVGYVGSDFKHGNDECICIFESYDEEKGFGNYNCYLLKNLKKVEVIETITPRYLEKINFEFEVPEVVYKHD